MSKAKATVCICISVYLYIFVSFCFQETRPALDFVPAVHHWSAAAWSGPFSSRRPGSGACSQHDRGRWYDWNQYDGLEENKIHHPASSSFKTIYVVPANLRCSCWCNKQWSFSQDSLRTFTWRGNRWQHSTFRSGWRQIALHERTCQNHHTKAIWDGLSHVGSGRSGSTTVIWKSAKRQVTGETGDSRQTPIYDP